MTKLFDDDIRLVYIGSAHRAIHYAADHLPEPSPRADQILAVTDVAQLEGLQLSPWCHIGTELHTIHSAGERQTRPALGSDAAVLFEAALAKRRKLPKAGV